MLNIYKQWCGKYIIKLLFKKTSNIDQTFTPHLKNFRIILFLTSTQSTQIHVMLKMILFQTKSNMPPWVENKRRYFVNIILKSFFRYGVIYICM